MDTSPTTYDYQRLMAEVLALRDRQSVRRGVDLVQRFRVLRFGWASLRQRIIDRERLIAPRHNLIRFLDLTRSEIGFHSPFLCDLLDPYGTHGQGTLFLQTFLDTLTDKAHCSGANNWTYQWLDLKDVKAGEWVVLGENGKIDISIRNRAQKVLIFMENKIGAREQDKQLTRYRERLEQQRESYNHRLLLFLSPGVYEPSSGHPDIKLTYEGDINQWIGSVMDKIPRATAPGLYGNLDQYRNIVTGIQSEGDANMSNQELIDLMAQRENLQCAWDVADSINDVETALYSRFWHHLETCVRDGLANLNMGTAWSVKLIESPKVSFGNRYQEIEVSRSEARSPNRLCLAIYLDGAKLLCGLGFCKQQPVDHPLEQIQAVRKVLSDTWRGPDDWWIGYYDSLHRIPSRSFLLDVAADLVSVGQPLVDSLMTVLKDHEDLVVAADKALQAVEQ